jgi:hypothetical protein
MELIKSTCGKKIIIQREILKDLTLQIRRSYNLGEKGSPATAVKE